MANARLVKVTGVVCLFGVLLVSALPSRYYSLSTLLQGTSTKKMPMFGVALDGYPVTPSRLQGITTELGYSPDLVLFFLQWPQNPNSGAFPHESIATIHKAGAMPVLTWEPFYVDELGEHPILAETILSGEYDTMLRNFGDGARKWGKPFIVRLMHEMNLKRYHWGTTEASYCETSPAIYRKLFRHIVSTVRDSRPTPILWAFSPNVDSIPGQFTTNSDEWNEISAYYPGDDVVDILGLDGYNWGKSATMAQDGWTSQWRSFSDLFLDPVLKLRLLNATKPIVVFELASVGGMVAEGNLGPNGSYGDSEETQHTQTSWLQDAIQKASELEIEGLIWFHENKERDWKLRGKFLDIAPRGFATRKVSPSLVRGGETIR